MMAALQADAGLKQRQRQFLGLDPNAPPSPLDFANVMTRIFEAGEGKHPSMTPPGYEPQSGVPETSKEDEDLPQKLDSLSVKPAGSSTRAKLPEFWKKEQRGYPSFINISAEAEEKLRLEVENARKEMDEQCGGPFTREQSLQAMQNLYEWRAKEEQTKEGREKWAKLEAGPLGPKGIKVTDEKRCEKDRLSKPIPNGYEDMELIRLADEAEAKLKAVVGKKPGKK